MSNKNKTFAITNSLEINQSHNIFFGFQHQSVSALGCMRCGPWAARAAARVGAEALAWRSVAAAERSETSVSHDAGRPLYE